jgi:phosphoribosylformimino-5-aminoimidazole carboxamide ribotide isomerase
MMQVIPSIDLLDGKVVRLLKGAYDAVTVYGDDAAAVARSWQGQAARLHVVDLEGARSGCASQMDQVRRIVEAFGSGVQIGGGVRSFATIRSYFDLGIDRVVLGTAALSDPDLLNQATQVFGGRIILAVDGRQGRVATHGWHQQSDQLAIDVVRARSHLDLAAVLYTDIERDGTEIGPNIAETARLGREGGVPVIASGGVGTLKHLEQLAAASNEGNIVGAIIGRSLHEKRFTLRQAIEVVGAQLKLSGKVSRAL